MKSLVKIGLLFLPTVCFARFCIDSNKGWCKGHEIWGFCFHNKTSGIFNCDESSYCVGQEQLKNKKSTGCFTKDNVTVCCCNEADGCNLGFIPLPPKYAVGQSCTHTLEEPNEDIKMFKSCDDPYCYAMLTAELGGTTTTVNRGCYSRKIVMHHIHKDMNDKFHNNTRWKETEILANRPTCSQVLMGVEENNGTISLCLDFNYQVDDPDVDGEKLAMKGRLCCCKGNHKCNEQFMWGDEAINEETLQSRITAARVQKLASIYHSSHAITLLTTLITVASLLL